MDKTFEEMREEAGIPHKSMYTVTEVSVATGIARSTVAEDFRAGRIASFLPPGRKRGMLARPEWVDEYLSKGKKEAIGC